MRILLIDDDKNIRHSLELYFAGQGIACMSASNGEEALELLHLQDKNNNNNPGFDLIILDLRLVNEDGIDILIKIRQAKVKTPVLILSGLTASEQKATGLEKGADDYVEKPYNARELMARINAVIRRSKGHAQSEITFNKLSLNMTTKTVEVDGQLVHLTGKEYGIIELLILKKDHVLTKEMFLNHLYSGMDEPELKIIDVFVCKLRKKLSEASGGINYIETVWGRGYMLKQFDDEIENQDETAPAA